MLLLAAALRVWRLDQNGWGNEYYTASVRSMAGSWHTFLYASFDPAGFVSVDKPPVALWLQVASVKLLGFHEWAVVLPQVLAGVATVWLVSHLVRRRFGEPAGVLAGLFIALTPVSVAVDRSTNTESCLALVLVLAAWALSRATEDGRRPLLLVAAALIGLGFNVKMLAAFVVVPTFALVYWLGAPVSARRRVADLALAGVVLAAVSAPWVIAYDLTPPDRRPFAGSSKQNSMVELAVGHNAVGRFVRAGSAPRAASAAPTPVAGAGPRGAYAGLFVRAPVGPLRLADGQLAGQALWLLPLAAMGLVAGSFHARHRKPPLAPAHLALLLWLGWALTYAVVDSYAGGIFHFYYLSTMAPPLAALAGIGVAGLWGFYLQGSRRALLLPTALVLTAAWQLHIQLSALGWSAERLAGGPIALLSTAGRTGDWLAWLHLALAGGVLLNAVALAAMSPERSEGAEPSLGPAVRALARGALVAAVLALLAAPAAWALSSVLVPGNGILPSADLPRLLPSDGDPEEPPRARVAAGRGAGVRRLIDFLAANRQGERYLLATSGTRVAAPIIIETGEPVMAMGGFHGLDQILTPEALARMAERRQVRFVLLGDLSPISRRLGGEAAVRRVADWVRAHGAPVDPSLWRSAARGAGGSSRRGLGAAMELYDLRPQAGLVRAGG
jgi:4-amino-4-deoxy-L-arabinose transferase-like glycosyltransferase